MLIDTTYKDMKRQTETRDSVYSDKNQANCKILYTVDTINKPLHTFKHGWTLQHADHCLHGVAPSYLAMGFLRTADVDSWWRLQSASTSALIVPTTLLAPSTWQPRGPATTRHLVSRRHHLCPRSGASSRHYFLPEAIPTASTAHDKLFSSCGEFHLFVWRC